MWQKHQSQTKPRRLLKVVVRHDARYGEADRYDHLLLHAK